MPAGNGTGPMGMGPMTGRAAGYCAGFGRPGFMAPGPGRGMGFGFRGGGRGRRRRGFWCGPWAAPGSGAWPGAAAAGGFMGPSREQEKEMLKGQIEHLESNLSELKQRLTELEAERQQGDEE